MCSSSGLPFMVARQLTAAIPESVSILSEEREEEGVLGSCIHFIRESKVFLTLPAEVLLPLIGQFYHLTPCPPLAARKVAKERGLGNVPRVNKIPSYCHTQLSGNYISILCDLWEEIPIMTGFHFSLLCGDTMGLGWISKKSVKTKQMQIKNNNKKEKVKGDFFIHQSLWL